MHFRSSGGTLERNDVTVRLADRDFAYADICRQSATGQLELDASSAFEAKNGVWRTLTLILSGTMYNPKGISLAEKCVVWTSAQRSTEKLMRKILITLFLSILPFYWDILLSSTNADEMATQIRQSDNLNYFSTLTVWGLKRIVKFSKRLAAGI